MEDTWATSRPIATAVESVDYNRNDTQVKLKLLQNAEPYHARVCPIPRCHVSALKMEVKCLCQIGVLKKVIQSQWAVSTFITPKKDGSMHFISDCQ